jgi:serine protease AprX
MNTLRDQFQRDAAAIRSDLEARTVPRMARERMMPGAMRGAVQLAWLIRSIRAPLDPRVLADLAGAREIDRADLPRRLTPEIDVSCPVVGAPALRASIDATGKGVVVAVIDSEVLLTHSGLEERVTHKENYTLEAFGNPDEHGTAVAGIIASADDRFLGVAPEALIHSYKVLATDPDAGGDDFSGALAIQRALEDGARVANCSWGAGPASDGNSREARACDAAWDLGLVLVKSAGNRGPGAGTMTTPADARGIIAVGGASRDGEALGDYSSRGPCANGRHPDLLAPGGTEDDGIRSCRPNGRYGDAGHGTSYAAPHVSGLLALLLEKEPLLTPDELKARLLERCRPLAGLSVNEQGAGLVDFT